MKKLLISVINANRNNPWGCLVVISAPLDYVQNCQESVVDFIKIY